MKKLTFFDPNNNLTLTTEVEVKRGGASENTKRGVEFWKFCVIAQIKILDTFVPRCCVPTTCDKSLEDYLIPWDTGVAIGRVLLPFLGSGGQTLGLATCQGVRKGNVVLIKVSKYILSEVNC